MIFDVEQLETCRDAVGVLIRSGTFQDGRGAELMLLDQVAGTRLGLQGLSETVCFDPLRGLVVSGGAPTGEPMVGFGVIPADDLAKDRGDRTSVLLVSGTSAEISYD